MRLLLACISLFLAPAGALIITDRYAAAIEDEFLRDAQVQVDRLNRVVDLYPPNVKKMRSAPAIMQLRDMVSSGWMVAANVCSTPAPHYQRLFDRLKDRCDRWALLRRARRTAFFATVLSALVFAVVLMARIRVQGSVAREEWPGAWSHWFVVRGMPLMIFAQVAISLIGYAVILQTVTGRTLFALAILAIPFAALFWIERRLVLAFVEPQALAAFRPKRASGGRRRREIDFFGDPNRVEY